MAKTTEVLDVRGPDAEKLVREVSLKAILPGDWPSDSFGGLLPVHPGHEVRMTVAEVL